MQVAPDSSSEVPDEPGGVRAVVLGVTHSHTGRDGSQAMVEIQDMLMQRAIHQEYIVIHWYSLLQMRAR